MGWTAGEDMLRQVELTFPTLESAVGYARRQGLHFIVQGAPQSDRIVSNLQESEPTQSTRKAVRRTWRHEWTERTLGPEVIRNGSPLDWDLTFVYGSPEEVVHDLELPMDKKREVLRRWALDSYLTELALAKGEAVDHVPVFEKAVDALIELESSAGPR
jgi:ETC complex I subunit conserved region